MNIAEWQQRIKSAKFHLSNAKNDFQKQVAQHDFRAVCSEFGTTFYKWQRAYHSETDQIVMRRADEAKRIRDAFDRVCCELESIKETYIK
jgi:dihydroorotase